MLIPGYFTGAHDDSEKEQTVAHTVATEDFQIFYIYTSFREVLG